MRRLYSATQACPADESSNPSPVRDLGLSQNASYSRSTNTLSPPRFTQI